MAGHVTNLATKLEDPTPIRSWVMSYNGSHWLPLKMRSRPLRVRRITWPVSRGWKTITFLESPPPEKVAESLCAEGREITHAQNRNPWMDLDKILHGGRYPRRSYLHKFWWPSVKGFLGGGGSNFPISHWLSSSPLQHSRTTWFCMLRYVARSSSGGVSAKVPAILHPKF